MIENQIVKKPCSICKKQKTLDSFYKTRGEQRHSYCHDCMRIYKRKTDKAYRERNKIKNNYGGNF